MSCGFFIPVDGYTAIALARRLSRQFQLRRWLLLSGRFGIPLARFFTIFAHANALFEPFGQMKLRLCISLHRGFAVPFCRLGWIGGHAKAAFIHESQVPLRPRITLLCRLAIPEQCLSIVNRCAATIEVNPSQLIFSRGIALVRCFGEPAYRLFAIRLHMHSEV